MIEGGRSAGDLLHSQRYRTDMRRNGTYISTRPARRSAGKASELQFVIGAKASRTIARFESLEIERQSLRIPRYCLLRFEPSFGEC